MPVMALLHARYGAQVVLPFVRIFPAGAFGICLFNLVAARTLERLGLPATIVLAYGVDLVYLATVAWLSRPREVTAC
jgi:Zn-dependent protease with chaperone function